MKVRDRCIKSPAFAAALASDPGEALSDAGLDITFRNPDGSSQRLSDILAGMPQERRKEVLLPLLGKSQAPSLKEYSVGRFGTPLKADEEGEEEGEEVAVNVAVAVNAAVAVNVAAATNVVAVVNAGAAANAVAAVNISVSVTGHGNSHHLHAKTNGNANLESIAPVVLSEEYLASLLWESLSELRLSPSRQAALFGFAADGLRRSIDKLIEGEEHRLDYSYRGLDMTFVVTRCGDSLLVTNGVVRH